MLIHKSCGKRDVSWKPTSEIQVGEFRGEVGELGLLDRSTRNSKGCDIGYALATNSCEGANSVDA